MNSDKKSFKNIPQIGKLMENPFFRERVEEFSREEVYLAIKNSIEEIKNEGIENLTKIQVEEKIKEYSLNFLKYPYRKVVNGTGVLIHTNLGRAPLIKVEKNLIETYSNLEISLKDGKRGERNALSEKILSYLTSSEAAIVVNNNASMVLLLLSTFAKGGEVIVSRGELVEIGGSFRLPEILKESGASMVEVGTTNKTRISDYEKAINENTKAILKVHQANFRILGYSEFPSIEQLSKLAHQKNLPLFVDQGNGLLFEIEGFDLKEEEPVSNLIKKGADLVTFSGDKLLGGPQAGIGVGKKIYIEKMLKNPLYRALRPGKETFFYLQETLKLWLRKDFKSIPLWKMAMEDLKFLKKRAEKILKKTDLPLKIENSQAQFGGGTTPLYNIPSISLVLKVPKPEKIYKFLLNFETPVITFIKEDAVNINLRSIFEEEDEIIISALEKLKNSGLI
ncbi:MAG: L-seryl-tRNA(Sec) selenium transferase [Thermoanaerobaculia bacterium]